jgi:iron(III) transport system permease protein
VTLPGARYGLISATFVVFTLVITDFGVPKVIGGQFNMLATDIYKQVVGQQNFQMGAVVSLLLLLPALVAFSSNAGRRPGKFAGRVQPRRAYQPKPRQSRDVGAAGPGEFNSRCDDPGHSRHGGVRFAGEAVALRSQPDPESLRFQRADGGSWASYGNSIRLALYTALFGSLIVFAGAYLVEKSRVARTAAHGHASIGADSHGGAGHGAGAWPISSSSTRPAIR